MKAAQASANSMFFRFAPKKSRHEKMGTKLKGKTIDRRAAATATIKQ
jgi:hypothetical protein